VQIKSFSHKILIHHEANGQQAKGFHPAVALRAT